jgi:outer membrane protein OmpA-like peptidoglycan-associated protein
MIKNSITLTLAVLLLAGCTGTGTSLHSAKKMSPDQSDKFEVNLYQNYIELAQMQIKQNDARDRDWFAGRSARVARGRHVEPSLVICRKLSDQHVIELTNARTDLTLAFDNMARLIAPKWAAKAQSSYDCWIEEQEDNRRPELIEQCREEFYSAMQQIQAIYADHVKNTVKPEPPQSNFAFEDKAPDAPSFLSENFIVYFDYDKSEIRADAMGTLEAVLGILKENPGVKISLRGHTDRVASDDYNDKLSKRRSNEIANWLKTEGISSDRVEISSFGERMPAIQTEDSIREARNRRVEIIMFE